MKPGPSHLPTALAPAPGRSAQGTHSLPRWISRLMACNDLPASEHTDGPIAARCRTTAACDLSLASVTIAAPEAHPAHEFERLTARAYALARALLEESGAAHPVRVWNFVPRIHSPVEPGIDRYLSFNRARYEYLSSWFAGPATFASTLPTATAVGHTGDDLAIHVLASTHPGRAVDNPRQRPAFEYSPRYGPRPPCFARATVARIDGQDRLLIGGTASIRGEDSMHSGNLPHQVQELFENLTTLLAASTPGASIADIRSIRVYHPRASDRDALLREVASRLPAVRDAEWVIAELCRPELLVEIEGVA